MSKNIEQVYTANPITSIGDTDLLYVGVGGTVDGAINGSNFKIQSASISPYIVGAGGNFTTIQAAINKAVTDGASSSNVLDVIITAGTYHENLTLAPWVNLIGVGDGTFNSINVIGNAVFSPSVNNDIFSANGVSFITPAGLGSAFNVGGSNIAICNLTTCQLSATTDTAFTCTNTNAIININNCSLNALSTLSIFTISQGALSVSNSILSSVDTPSIFSNAARLMIYSSTINDSYTLNDSSILEIYNSVSITPIGLFFVTVGVSAECLITNSILNTNSSNSYFITGTGVSIINGVSCIGTSALVDPALNSINTSILIGNLSFDGGTTDLNTDGQLVIGNTAGQPKISTLTAGAGINITNGNGSITLAATGSGLISGTPFDFVSLDAAGTTIVDGGYSASNTSGGGIVAIATGQPVVSGNLAVFSDTNGTLADNGYSIPLSLSNGGTNASLTANNGGIFYSDASAGAILAGTATASQTLLSGANSAPSWSTATYPATIGPNQLLYSSNTNVISGLTTNSNRVLTTGPSGVPSLASSLPTTVQSVITGVGTIGSGTWQGSIIGLTYGGTGANITPDNGGIFYSNATTGALLAATATANQVLLSGSSTTPSWSTAIYPTTTTANQLLYSSATNTISGLGSVNNAILSTDGSGVPSLSNTIPASIIMPQPAIEGYTDGSARPVGFIGEITSASMAISVSLTSSTITNVVTMALAAGNWAIDGIAAISATNTSIVNSISVSISTSPTVLPSLGGAATTVSNPNVTVGVGGASWGQNTGILYVQLSSPTTYYLVVNVMFTGTCTGGGYIQAERYT